MVGDRARNIGGKGSDRRYVSEQVEEARRLGMSNVYLFTFDKQSMYERLGWSVLEDARYSGRACTIMGRRLDPDIDSDD